MHTSSPIAKIFQGVASRREMFSLFNRHSEAPFDEVRLSGSHSVGEWFEIGEAEHDYMLDLLPPLFMRGDLFAMSEFLTGSVTSIFLSLNIDGKSRWFHGYCDLSDKGSPDRLHAAIIERESRPVKAMTRAERLEHIWSTTHADYRGYDGRGQRTVLVYGGRQGTFLKPLDDLTEDDITAKLPVQLRNLPEPIAA